MFKKTVIFTVLVCFIFSYTLCYADERKIITYYPSPTGSYEKLRATTIIGEEKSTPLSPREWSMLHQNTAVGPFDRVTGSNADYLDGRSVEEYFVIPNDTPTSNLCYPVPIVEIKNVNIGVWDFGNVYVSGCPLRFSFVKNIAYFTGTPLTVGGIDIWGLFWCCNYRPGSLSCGTNFLEKVFICLSCVIMRGVGLPFGGCDSCYSEAAYPFNLTGLTKCITDNLFFP